MTETDLREYIDSRITQKGGFQMDQLAVWGVAWPPKKGWKQELIQFPTKELLDDARKNIDKKQLSLL